MFLTENLSAKFCAACLETIDAGYPHNAGSCVKVVLTGAQLENGLRCYARSKMLRERALLCESELTFAAGSERIMFHAELEEPLFIYCNRADLAANNSRCKIGDLRCI